MSKISLNGIGKSFEHLDVLDNLNLDIMDNELMVVLGSSGCGKTTMLNIISGLMKQDKGDLYIDDKLVNGAPPEKRPIGMVFQDYLEIFNFPLNRLCIDIPVNVPASLKVKSHESIHPAKLAGKSFFCHFIEMYGVMK